LARLLTAGYPEEAFSSETRMTKMTDDYCAPNTCGPSDLRSAAELNQSCYCKTLDNQRLQRLLEAEGINQSPEQSAFFSSTATFLSERDFTSIRHTIFAIERVLALPAYRQWVTAQAHPNARHDSGVAGSFMGYDFHVGEEQPKLIEINTNAGGAFLNAILLDAQSACCPPMEQPLLQDKNALYREFFQMFINEWRLQRGDQPLQRIAIVDRHPTEQFLYPEFLIAKSLFEAHGVSTVIVDPEALVFEQEMLLHQGRPIDLIYNRLTDFTLSEDSSRALNRAYQAGAVVVTPNPFLHAVYADKRNLTGLSDPTLLASMGVTADDIAQLTTAIPRTIQLTRDNAESVWQQRRDWFFKPVSGFGSKATYRGDKLTKRVWEEILQNPYVAQARVSPSERGILLDGVPSSLKLDIRAYVYQGNIQLLAARLYQGQTTNFRTSGGGFSPVFVH
jgi:hypothetical protein